jgi:hypothetical protein
LILYYFTSINLVMTDYLHIICYITSPTWTILDSLAAECQILP